MNVSTKDISSTKLDELCIQTIRFLAADAVEKANSGHPGMPMAMAPAAYTLWTKHLRHNPANPKWHNRDRFILSAGHGSALLYALMHLNGYDISLEDIKNFRQWASKTPGHPEYNPAGGGAEVTTGPLGQGLANAVGMAIAEKYTANYFNRDGLPIIDYKIYTVVGDGCLEEGISSEACSLAGHLGLNNLIVIYDDNRITIDGDTQLCFTENIVKRFESYNWNVEVVAGDGNDMVAFEKALNNAKNTDKPTLIKLRTHIAFGSPNKQDTAAAHGAPLGEDEIRLIKEKFGFDPDKSFHIPPEVAAHMQKALQKGSQAEAKWDEIFAKYAKQHPQLAKQFNEAASGKLSVNIDALLPKFETGKAVATRKASGMVLDAVMPELPMILGGSADLTSSNNTKFTGAKDFQKNTPNGRYIYYGVREHAMGAIMNGISVSGLTRAYGGTFFVFSDYMRPAIRVAALSKYPSIFVFTHDSIGVGEDGPTHQPVEHLAALRAIPNLIVLRPADANETAAAWNFTLNYKDGPVALILTRQSLPVLKQTQLDTAANFDKGAYVLVKNEKPDVLLIATGSEVSLAVDACEKLSKENIKACVISMPSWKLFEKQTKEYQDSVLLPGVKVRIAVEAGIKQGWEKWLGENGVFIGMSSFGASAPGNVCFEKFGITSEKIVEAAKKIIKKSEKDKAK